MEMITAKQVQHLEDDLDRFNDDAGIDQERVAITGGSYGGYMCYAGAIRYGPRLRGANCVVAGLVCACAGNASA